MCLSFSKLPYISLCQVSIEKHHKFLSFSSKDKFCSLDKFKEHEQETFMLRNSNPYYSRFFQPLMQHGMLSHKSPSTRTKGSFDGKRKVFPFISQKFSFVLICSHSFLLLLIFSHLFSLILHNYLNYICFFVKKI